MSISTKFLGASLLALAGAVAVMPATAFAQVADASPAAEDDSYGDDIVVTARKREESLQEVPIAITAFSAEGLREKSINNTEDLVAHTPSLQIRSNGAVRSDGGFFLRGQGNTFGTRPGVIVYTNEVAAFGPGIPNGFILGNNTQFYDLQNIQVLKGPQGTLFGASTTGGAVLLTTQKPTDEFEGWIEAKLGNYNSKQLTGAINIPIIKDHVLLRVAGDVLRRDGFTTSLITGQDNDDKHRDSYRISLALKPVDWLENLTIFRGETINEAATGIVLEEFNPGFISGTLRDRSRAITTGPNTGPAANVFAFDPGGRPLYNPALYNPLLAGLCGAINPGNAAGAATCTAQRQGLMTSLVAALNAEVARVRGGGSIRQNASSTIGSTAGNTQQLTNITTIRPGDLGSVLGEVTIKNIFATNRVGIASSTRTVAGAPNFHADTSNGVDIISGVVTPSARFSRRKFFDNWSNEIQVGGQSALLDWQVGFYRFHYENPLSAGPALFSTFADAFDTSTPVGVGGIQGSFTLNEKINDTGYFGQVTIRPVDRLSITAGYRKSKFTRTAQNATALLSATGLVPNVITNANPIDQSAPSYNFAIDYKATPDLLIYVTHRKGFKPGGANLLPAVDPTTLPGYVFTYAPESVLDYEAGIKYTFRSGDVRGRVNLAGYHSDYSSVQRNQTLSVPGTTGVFTQISNVGKVKITGFELESEFNIGDRLTIGANANYTNARYTDYPGNDFTVVTPPLTYTNTAGATTVAYPAVPNVNSAYPSTPKFQFSINARYAIVKDDNIGEIAISGNFYHQSSVALSDDLVEDPLRVGFQPAYGIVNARIDWLNIMGKPIDASLNVTNLTQKVYKVGAANLIAALGVVGAIYNEPRMITGSVRFRF